MTDSHRPGATCIGERCDICFIDAFSALRAKLNTAFDRWVAAPPAMVSERKKEYYALIDQMRALCGEKVM